MNDFFRVTHLSKKWPTVDIDVSFSLAPGASLAIVGPSGCGKSSTLKMIAGLLACDSGSVTLGGVDILSLPPARRGVGFMFQEHALFPHLSVEDNIGYGLVSSGMTKRKSRMEAVSWLNKLGLEGFAKRRIDSLSGGEKQRVSLARTLAVNPALVLFDEPLSSLDARLRTRLQTELRSRQKELGYAAVYVTHDEAEAAFLGDTVYRMK